LSGRDKDGYGKICMGGKPNIRVHRLMYSTFVAPIPEGMVVMHSCNNPPCCNPAHLSVGTVAENNAYMVACGRQTTGDKRTIIPRGSRHGRALLTEDDVREIRAVYSRGGVTQKQLATKYGVGRGTVQHIVTTSASGSWRHLW
jgi:hypothetical protein